LLVYQEIMTALRPDSIIETGVAYGGSALFFADLCAAIGHGEVLGVDIRLPSMPPSHPRLTLLEGDSVAPATIERVCDWADGRRGMVILDSDHSMQHVLSELDAYSPFVAPGSFLIVEDTNVNGHPVCPDFGPGPYEAVEAWLPQHPEFVCDRDVEPFVTFAPSGYVRRIG
jgi:cephalosporin hydroxylase